MTCPTQTSLRIVHHESCEIPLIVFDGGHVAVAMSDINVLFGVTVDPRLTVGVRKARCTRLGRSGEFWVMGLNAIRDAAVRVRLPERRQRALDVAVWAATVGVSPSLWGEDEPSVTVERPATPAGTATYRYWQTA